MFRIANPIYDTAFKYLMSDEKTAILLLSAITSEKIVSLKFEPQEYTIIRNLGLEEIEARERIEVMRIDFAAIIIDKNGKEKAVSFELQKNRLAGDLMRFRRYLALQLLNPGNVQKESANDLRKIGSRPDVFSEFPDTTGKQRKIGSRPDVFLEFPDTTGKQRKIGSRPDVFSEFPDNTGKHPRPIYTIYFLADSYTSLLPDRPVIRIAPCMTDVATGECLSSPVGFMDALHQQSWVVQTQLLPEKPRTDLEEALVYFDQRYQSSVERYDMDMKGVYLSDKYLPIGRRLGEIAMDEYSRRLLMEEDYLANGIADLRRKNNEQKEELQRLNREQKEELQRLNREQTEELREKDSTIADQASTITEQAEELKEKDRQIAELLARVRKSEKK